MKFNNNKGFTMILVLLVIAVLSILGTTLLFLTVSNYKMKIINTKAKQSFYLSEAGLEESYAKVYYLINDSIQKGNKSANDFLENFSYEEEIQNELEGINSPYIDENGQIDEENLEKEMNNKFKKAFQANVKMNIKDIIEIDTPYEHNEIKYDSIEVLKPNPKFESGIMNVKIESTSSVGEVKRTLQVTLVITTPEYNGSYTIEGSGNNTTQTTNNSILTKVISANNSINFNKGTNYVHGDIIAETIAGDTQNVDGDKTETTDDSKVSQQLASNNSSVEIITNNEIIYIANTNNSNGGNSNNNGNHNGNNGNDDICILGKNYSKVSLTNKDYTTIRKAYTIDLSNTSGSTTYSGIIISKKDIYIVGDINFTGTIISRKDVKIYTHNESNFYYDANYIENAINEYNLSEYFTNYNSDIFEQNINFGSVLTINNLNPEDFIELKNWQIP